MTVESSPRWDIPAVLWAAYEANYDHIAQTHLAHFRNTGQNPWIPEDRWRQWEQVTADLIEHFQPDGPILDCGVGQGRLLSLLPPREKHGIDIAAAYVPEAQANGIAAVQGRLEDLPYHDGQFSAVVATDILEHVLDLNRCASEALRVLKPGGHLFVRTPDSEDLSPYVAGPFQFIHLRSFTEQSHRLLWTTVFGCEVVAVVRVDVEIAVVIRKP